MIKAAGYVYNGAHWTREAASQNEIMGHVADALQAGWSVTSEAGRPVDRAVVARLTGRTL